MEVNLDIPGLSFIVDHDPIFGLTSITIPNTVTSIGNNAFASCSKMTGIYFTGNALTLGTSAFSGDSATVYYLPWKLGWTSTFGGLLTAPWNLPVEPAVPAVLTDGFGFAPELCQAYSSPAAPATLHTKETKQKKD